jgi:hypothetical protein
MDWRSHDCERGTQECVRHERSRTMVVEDEVDKDKVVEVFTHHVFNHLVFIQLLTRWAGGRRWLGV